MPQKPPFGPRFANDAQETVVTLFVTAARVRRAFARAVEPHDITLQQLNVLRILRGAGAEGLLTMAIAQRMVERDPGITKLIDRLERKGLVTRQREKSDRRRIAVVITKPGRALLSRLSRPIARADAFSVAGLSASDRRHLITLLRKLKSDGNVRK